MIRRHENAVMLLIVMAIAAVGFSWEVIQLNNGRGFDGRAYSDPNLQFSSYFMGRAVPILLARLLPFDPVLSWRIMNFVAVMGSCFLWMAISRELNLKGGKWLGLCGLFLTFQSKQFYFEPVRVDAVAMFTAMLLLWLHLKRHLAALFAATIFASFCWPTAGMVGAALLMFRGEGEHRPIRGLRPFLIVTMFAMLAYVVAWYLRSPLRSLFTGIPSFALLCVAAYPLLDRYRLRYWWAALVFLLPTAVILSARGRNPGGADLILSYILMPDSGMFFLPVISLAVYFGPVFVLAALNWSKTVEAAKALGVTLPLLINLPFALTTEPRHFLFGWPFLVVCVAKALDFFSWRIAILAILWAKFWLPINYAPWGKEDTELWPEQLWYMNFGYFMTYPTFVFHAILVALTAYLLATRQPLSALRN